MEAIMSTHTSEWIAKRTLYNDQGRAVLDVRLGIPHEVSEREWQCPFQLVEAGQPDILDAGHGNDAFQALQLAMEHIRVKLEARGQALHWDSGESGDTGFYRAIPMFFGLSFARNIEAHIDRELESFANALQAQPPS
jgi:hypothetical protein